MNDPLSICRVHHAQITIPHGQENEARRFYCGLLNLREIPKPPSLAGRGGLWLVLGEFQIHLGTEEHPGGRSSKAHLAYEVNGLDQWREKLQKHGIEVHDGAAIPHYRRFEFRDPFGNRVEFLERFEP